MLWGFRVAELVRRLREKLFREGRREEAVGSYQRSLIGRYGDHVRWKWVRTINNKLPTVNGMEYWGMFQMK